MLGTYQRPETKSARLVFLSQSGFGNRYKDVSPGRVESWELGGNPLPAHSAMDSESDFEAIFLEHYPRVLGMLTRLTGNRAQAEDVAVEVFWRLSRRPMHWLLTNNVGAWLYRTATHAGIDSLRAATQRSGRERATARLGDGQQMDPAEPLAEVLREETRRTVQVVLGSMKVAQAQLLLMRAGGSSYKELAQALNVAPGSVGTLLNRAEAEFRKRYSKVTGKKEKL